jgi:hypothetical protein
MKKLNLKEVTKYVEDNIGAFHLKRLTALEKLRLHEVLQRKNPYLFKAKNMLTAQDLVKNVLDAYLQSQEETMFGDFMEGIAIFICGKIFGGVKSKLVGIDLEFERDNTKYVVEIKSGPNWANSSQTKKMRDNFATAIKNLEIELKDKKVIAVNGCCYGRENQIQKSDYLKLCGQRFWEFISGDNNLYTEIIEPLGHKAKQQNEDFLIAYSQIINKFTLSFALEFCDDGIINWEKLVQFNSSTIQPEKPNKKRKKE